MPTERDKREQIARAVLHVVATEGIAAVSFRNVAAAAGVSPGRVQYYFPTKQQLVRGGLIAMLAGAEERHRERVGTLDARRELEELLGHALAGDAPFRRGAGIFYAYVSAADVDDEIRELLGEAMAGVLADATALLRRLGVPEREAGARAAELVAQADGMALAVYLGLLTPSAAQGRLTAAVGRALA